MMAKQFAAGVLVLSAANAPWPKESTQATAIRSGPISAEERQFWSLQPVKSAAPPKVSDAAETLDALDGAITFRSRDCIVTGYGTTPQTATGSLFVAVTRNLPSALNARERTPRVPVSSTCVR
jgi:hypothetical protein